jgi:uncharacterized protein
MMSKFIVSANVAPTEVSLESMVPDEHVRSVLVGTPKSGSTKLVRTGDGNAVVWVWECTAGTFVWDYTEEETAYIISGEFFVSTHNGAETRFGEGDLIFFPGGTSYKWRVTVPVRKVAVTRIHLPVPMGFSMRAFHRVARILGLRGRSAL